MAIAPIDGSAIALAAPRGLQPLDGAARPAPAKEAEEAGATPFAELLGGLVASANARGVEATHVAKEFAAGRRDDIHGTMLALAKADIELRLVGNVRNKIVDAFYELWRMQV